MIEFIEFNERDLEDCALLYVSTFNAAPWNDNWNHSSAYNRLKDIYNTPGFFGLVGREEGSIKVAIFGCIEHWYSGYMFNLKEMFVQNDLRGKGVGSQILNVLNERLKEKGVDSIWLFTAEGDLTEKFYNKNGYRKSNGMLMMTLDI